MSGRVLARNAVWNFVGLAAPLIVGVVAIPPLIAALGTERFGVLAIIWMGIGYFSLLDLGLGRALTKLVAERLGANRTTDIGPLLWTALWLIVALGCAGAIVVALGAEVLVVQVLNTHAGLEREGVAAVRLLAAGLPAVVASTALVGVLEAHQRFAAITLVRVPLGVMTFAAPLATAQVTPSLVWATAALLAARVSAVVAYVLVAASVRPELRRPQRPRREDVGPLLRFGSWLTVSNVVGPLMVRFDRFFIGAIMTMTAVTYYVTPYEVLSRLQFMPRSIMGVLFPALTTAFVSDRQGLVRLYSRGDRSIFLLMLPVMSTFFLFAPEGLEVWLGDEFRAAGTVVVRWLAVGWLINSLALMPFTVLQSAGRPDLIAKSHLLQLAPYVVILWVLTTRFGIAGTAAAWFGRVLADTVVLNYLARSEIPALAPVTRRSQAFIAGMLGAFAAATLVDSLIARGVVLLIVSAVCLTLAWPLRRALPRADATRDRYASSLDAASSRVVE